MRMFAVVVVAVLALPAWSQEMPKPGPEHKLLKDREADRVKHEELVKGRGEEIKKLNQDKEANKETTDTVRAHAEIQSGQRLLGSVPADGSPGCGR